MTVRLAAAQKAPRATRKTVLTKIGVWATQRRSWPLARTEAAASTEGKGEEVPLSSPPENAIDAATHARRSIRNWPVSVTLRKRKKRGSVLEPTQFATTGQWWSKSSVQRSHARQCLERKGRSVRHVAQDPAWWFGAARGGEEAPPFASPPPARLATRPGSALASESWSTRNSEKQRTRVAHSSLSRRRGRGRTALFSSSVLSFQIRGSCQATKERNDAESSEAAEAATSLEPGRRLCGGANLPSVTTKRKPPIT